MDEVGYLVKPGSTYTNIEGVFAAGDGSDSKYPGCNRCNYWLYGSTRC
jgi:thioredoxin reductase